MNGLALDVPRFPGRLLWFEATTADEARQLARKVPKPDGWQTSRSYRGRYGLVATHRSRVGVDLEAIDPDVPREAVLTPAETLCQTSAEVHCDWFSAKEALAKALGDARLYDPRRLESPAHWHNRSAGRWRACRLTVPVGFTGWVVWEEADYRSTEDF
ncbi:MAG TPA: 4'-phosphopantetheinyl transferase superfamily protein [Acidimicrobiales bacterium]|nr:4'-phosphopantetheinyl transferase superfamily protein [Acidimicrobiales bacterium]